MKGRIRKKRKKQAYVEALERGNAYLKGALVRQDAAANGIIEALDARCELTEMLLYASVILAGGSVAIKTTGLKDMLEGKEIRHRIDPEKHMAYIEVMDKEKAKAVLDDGKID